ncbi:phospholipase D-like domain-containing protein [Muricoccus radiodurans]|uniref:phospholipase D-like domain-containing protein n=1 Tax=Muricoccus radiodurans TaxID=2231721 RepID=UPI003CF7BFBC
MTDATDASPAALLQPGRNCWTITRADRLAVIIDADEYFRAAHRAMLAAERRIMLIGWDFDARVALVPDEESPDAPTRLGDFILWLVRRRPDLEVFVLRWDLGALKSIFRGSTWITVLRWMRHPRITLKLDGAHPPTASHHQKIVVIDDSLAFCGGIDITSGRWDTREHRDDDPGRRNPGRQPHPPWHDATTALDGPVASKLGELARRRWQAAGGALLPPVRQRTVCWPEDLQPSIQGVSLAIARTSPEYADCGAVHEIEQLYLDLIGSARRHIYAESQYFASRRIAEAIAGRLTEPDGPEIVLINPVAAQGWLEPVAMDTARARLHEALRRLDMRARFRIYHPYTAGGAPIYVHAKVLVVDDRVLRIGSSNMNNRSMRLDTECDLVVDARADGNEHAAEAIAAVRNSLIAEHLGCRMDDVARSLADTGSLIGAIEALRGSGKSLRPYDRPDLSAVETWLADNEILDPEGPGGIFEPLAKGGLLRRLRFRRNWFRGRRARAPGE